MKKLFVLTALLISAALHLNAQAPSNDDCATAIDLGPAPSCNTSVTYSNENATNSNIGIENNPTCFNGGIATRDVWFSFVCPDTLFDFRVTLTGLGVNSIVNPQIAVYRGDCTPNDLFELDCAIADLGETELFIDLTGLTPGITYYLRISDYSQTASPNSGDFTLCVDPIPPVVTIDEGSSSLCAGVIADSGGPDGDYSSNEDYTFTICPDQPTSCITFTLDYFNIEAGDFTFGDVLTIYNGEDIFSPVLASINSFDMAGGGGVCFQVQGSSPCMTLQFVSDNNVELDGFLGHWQCSNQPCPPTPALTVNNPIEDQSIINAVSSPATQVTITNIQCNSDAYGSFTYPTAENDLQMEKGIVLSSGSVLDAPGFGANFVSSIMNTDGDPDLDILSDQQGGQESYDACVVEMDVFVATNELTFEYVFGSEEYPEFVFSPGGYNDIFAFLVSGPGIAGDPGLGAQKNIAVLPGGTTPVEINSVNNQVNWEYYRNNEIGQQISYDGLTSDYLGVKKSLTARTNVVPCNTYHLKLAIADRGDASFDSGVFVSEIKGGTPDMSVVFASGIDYFIEDCSGTGDLLVISLPEAPTQVTTFNTSIGGTATLGVDYVLNLPPTITFQPGETQLTFPIYPLTDALVEGTETILVTLSSNFGCGTVILKTITVNLLDDVAIDVNSGSDTLLVCAGATLQLEAEGAANYFWTPASAVSNPLIGNPTITPTADIQLVVTGSIASCVDMDTVFVKIIAPEVSVSTADNQLCQGESVLLTATNNTSNQGLLWSPAGSLNDPALQSPTATPTVTTTYTASVSIAGCLVTDTVTIYVDTLFFPVLAADTTVCQNYPVILASAVNQTSNYAWSPTAGLSDATISNPAATPDQTTTYTLTATSAHGYCVETETVTLNIISADVDIAGSDYLEICLGTTVSLQANSTPASATPVTWTPAFYVTNPTGPTTSATPDESVTIKATYNVNGCLVVDSVRIRVDSLPNMALSLQPVKDFYCPGDTVTILSQTYEPASFPDISILWLPDGVGQVTPDSFWNVVIRAQETDIYTRITNNHACIDTSMIEVPVDSLPVITLTASKSLVCIGETVLLTASVAPNQAVKWEPETGLSCSDCLTPTATITSSVNYMVRTPDANCPTSASIAIEALPVPIVSLPSGTVICAGDTVLLNTTPAELNTTYAWTSAPGGFTSAEAQPTVMPTATTAYTVTASNTACATTATATVTVATATVNAGVDQTVCDGTPVTLNADAGGVIGAYDWQIDGNTVAVTQQFTSNSSNSATYTVVFTYSSALCQTSDQVTVTVKPTPVLAAMTLNPAGRDVCEGEPLVLQTSTLGGTAPYTYTWQQDGTTVQSSSIDSLRVNLSGSEDGIDYLFTVSVVDASGCQDGPETANVTVVRCFHIPNAFTPDGNSANETFGLAVSPNTTITISKFNIYNRWGQKVFSSDGDQQSWDGNVDGKPAPPDVYIYQITIRRPDGVEENFSGEVTLIR